MRRDENLPEVVGPIEGHDSPETLYEQPLDYAGRDKLSPTTLVQESPLDAHDKEVIEPSASRDHRSRAICGLPMTRFLVLLIVAVLLITGAVVGGVLGSARARSDSSSDNSPTSSSSGASAQPSTGSMTMTLTSSVASPTNNSTRGCTGGTFAQGESPNYGGLCDFTCRYGYCPPGPCVCTSYGEIVSPPPVTTTDGCPLPGEGEGYKGLCSYSCNHGYCPPAACRPCQKAT